MNAHPKPTDGNRWQSMARPRGTGPTDCHPWACGNRQAALRFVSAHGTMTRFVPALLRSILMSCNAAYLLPLLFIVGAAHAEDDPKADKAKTVEHLAESARNSVVVIMFAGRDGKQQGLGTGFVLSKDGLIATNLHVIGEARPITVQLPDGTRHPVTAIHASDRALDLA